MVENFGCLKGFLVGEGGFVGSTVLKLSMFERVGSADGREDFSEGLFVDRKGLGLRVSVSKRLSSDGDRVGIAFCAVGSSVGISCGFGIGLSDGFDVGVFVKVLNPSDG